MSVCNTSAIVDINPKNNPDRVRPERSLKPHQNNVTRSQLGPRGHGLMISVSLKHRGSQHRGSTSHKCLSQASISQGHDSLDDAAGLVIPEVQEKSREEAHAPLKSYPRGPLDTSLLHLYSDHAAMHILEVYVFFFLFQYLCFQRIKSKLVVIFSFYTSVCLKLINHERKTLKLEHPNADWFQYIL